MRSDFGDLILPFRTRPRMLRGGDALTYQNSLRVYRDSPETICVQIRRETDYTNVFLTKAHAQEFLAFLQEKVDELR